MILELADIRITPGQQDAFEEAIAVSYTHLTLPTSDLV